MSNKIVIDWDSGDGATVNESIDSAIAEIAAMANKHNSNDDYQMVEEVARYALSTALYNPKLLRDVLAALVEQP